MFRMQSSFDPVVHQIRPRLQHGSTLLCVFGLVVNRAHTALLVGQALLDPVAVEPRLVQERAGRAPKVMDGDDNTIRIWCDLFSSVERAAYVDEVCSKGDQFL